MQPYRPCTEISQVTGLPLRFSRLLQTHQRHVPHGLPLVPLPPSLSILPPPKKDKKIEEKKKGIKNSQAFLPYQHHIPKVWEIALALSSSKAWNHPLKFFCRNSFMRTLALLTPFNNAIVLPVTKRNCPFHIRDVHFMTLPKL